MKKLIFFCTLTLLTVLSAKAGNVTKQISSIDGLSNNSVNCLFEDSENTVWIGTWDGLNAYDGREIRKYRYNKKNEHSISNNVIRQIFEQSQNFLWVSTDYGINKLDKNKQEFTSFFHNEENKKPKQENSYRLGISRSKTIYAYVKETGFFFYNEKAEKFTSLQIDLKTDLKKGVKDFLIDNEDNIYILSTDGEVYTAKLIEGNKGPHLLHLRKLTIPVSPVQKIFFSDNKLFLVCENEVTVFNKLHTLVKRIKTPLNKNISHLLLHQSELYISFFEGGCVIFDMVTNSMSAMEGISDKIQVFTLFADSQGTIWVGSDGQGVMMTYKYDPLFTTVPSDYSVRAFCFTANDDVLVATKGGGIKKLNKTNNTLEEFLNVTNGLASNSVYALKKNKYNDIFIGTEGKGINIKYANQNKIENLSFPKDFPSFKSVYSIHFSNNDSLLWLGTSGFGLIKASIIREKGKYKIGSAEQFVSTAGKQRSIGNDIIYTIADGETKGELYFGTRGGGLYTIAKELNTITLLKDNILTDNDILSIQHAQSGLWVGTSYGLNRIWRENGSLHNQEYTDHEGLANNTIHGIVEDKNNNIWVSTNLGLSFINLKTKKIENYAFTDGLQSNEFSDGAFFMDKNNTLYFGGVEGLNYFKPENIKRRDFIPYLKINNLRIYNTPQNIKQRIVNNELNLSYEEQYLSLTVITNDFINNQNCEYAYHLSDFTEEWIYNGNNPNIIFPKLSPGNYILNIKYTNGDKVWSDQIYTLQINVAQPWWFSKIALVIYALCLGLILYVIQSTLQNRFRLNRQILLEKIEKQHQQKVHEAKLDFFTNVAHEFFTPLTLIYGPAQHLLDTTNLDGYTRRYIRVIKNNAERMQKLINELMEFRKAKSGHKPIHPEEIAIKTLIDYISDNYVDLSEQNNIAYKVDISSDFTFFSDRDFLEKIVLNLISNAFKYTPNGGYIHVTVWQDEEDKSARISIRNSGKGLTSQQMEEIFNKFKIFDSPRQKNTLSTGIGLSLTKSLVELLGGWIKVYSQYGEYVDFDIKIPSLQLNTRETNTTPEENALLDLNITAEKEITILIVDDEKNIRELLKDILSPYYHILEAEDGIKAMDIIKYDHPNIIISDVMMPNIDGIMLIDKLKSDPATVHIPIISISAKISIDDSINAYKHGADLYIRKPFHPQHVISVVENLVKRQSQLKDYYNSGLSSVTIKDGFEIHKEDKTLIHKVAVYIQKNINDENLDPESIADFMGVSKATLYRKFKEILNSTPSELIRSIRLEYASKQLVITKLTVLEVMYKSGFNNKSYFYREFSKMYKMSPMEYRNKHRKNE